MRELKFRAWSKRCEEYIEDVIHEGTSWLEAEGYDYVDVSEIFDGDEFMVEQYTGLKDKNGTEIYEGDIVKCLFYRKDCIGQVAFDFVDDSEGYYIEKHYGWGIHRDGYNISLGDYADDNMRCELIEVIGNIHENPELLEGEK